VALAGAGAAATIHALAARAAGLRVTAVASAGGTSARHLAGQLDARRVEPRDLPAGADLLVVATPPEAHETLAIAGLVGGAAVLVETPIAATLAAADRLVATASATGGPALRVAENLRFSPVWRAVLPHRPRLGTLRHLSARTVQAPPTWRRPRPSAGAGGVLLDAGVHAVALVLEFAGSPPRGVAAELGAGHPDGAEDRARVRIRFDDGLVAGVEAAWAGTEPHWELQAAGDRGVVRMELVPEIVVEADGEELALPGPRHAAADPTLERFGYVDQLLDMAAGGAGAQRPEQARQVLEVICAASASAAGGGSEVVLPFAGDRTATPLQLWRG
jgi:predicted dehydrogenase